MKKILCVLFLIMILLEGLSYSQDIRATTEDGQKVILKKDGSWKFYNASKPSLANTYGSYQKSEEATSVFKAKGDMFLIWFDPSKWHQEKKKSADSEKPSFLHKDGDVYAMVLADRFGMELEALKKFAINNAIEVAPNTKVTYEENRIVNGKKVFCMIMEGSIESIPFVYYGYYYTSKVGTVQLVTYTSKNLFSEYKSEMTEFLNGLVIND